MTRRRTSASGTTATQGGVDRRSFLRAAATSGAGAVLGGGLIAQAQAGVRFPSEPQTFGTGGGVLGAVCRSEFDLYDCEVEGQIPADLDGAFYRVGPDPQYPKPDQFAHDIAFDGEGHLSQFRIQNGHVDFRSRYVRTQRWKAQHVARKSLFGMYRNPLTDDPSVKGVSRGTANTQMIFHHGRLFAMKEDSPPVALDPNTLETTDDRYTFGGGLPGETFTAHPRIDPVTGEMIAFGYEATGLASTDVSVFSANRAGKVEWSTWVKVPYAGMIHDFAVTTKHIAFLVIPLATNLELIRNGGPHFAWDSTLSSYLGVMSRGGDGKDIRWFKGQGWMATHVMGAWSDGDKLTVDMDGAGSNQFAFFPQLHETFDPRNAAGNLTRLSVDLSKRSSTYQKETLYPGVLGVLSRQDDRYHTLPYRYGYLLSYSDAGSRWALLDHKTRSARFFSAGPDSAVSEMCFVPRKPDAPEGDGYLIGIVERRRENRRSDVVLVDTRHPEDGPVATIKMPYRVPPQVHGLWVSGEHLAGSNA
jgi:carotenoid cleavage dioxygenase-like enzyme